MLFFNNNSSSLWLFSFQDLSENTVSSHDGQIPLPDTIQLKIRQILKLCMPGDWCLGENDALNVPFIYLCQVFFKSWDFVFQDGEKDSKDQKKLDAKMKDAEQDKGENGLCFFKQTLFCLFGFLAAEKLIRDRESSLLSLLLDLFQVLVANPPTFEQFPRSIVLELYPLVADQLKGKRKKRMKSLFFKKTNDYQNKDWISSMNMNFHKLAFFCFLDELLVLLFLAELVSDELTATLKTSSKTKEERAKR